MSSVGTDGNEIVYRFVEGDPWVRAWTVDVDTAIEIASRDYVRRYPGVFAFEVDIAERDPKCNRSLDGEMAVLPVWIRVAIELDRCMVLEKERRGYASNGRPLKRGRATR
jgi:hypothetical protein